MPSGLLYLFNVYSSSQHFAALIASAFFPIRQNFFTSHKLRAALGASTSFYLRHAGLRRPPLASNVFLKYLIIFGIPIYNSVPTFLSHVLKYHLVLLGIRKVGTTAASAGCGGLRGSRVPGHEAPALGRGGLRKGLSDVARLNALGEGGTSSRAVVARFSLSGYLPVRG